MSRDPSGTVSSSAGGDQRPEDQPSGGRPWPNSRAVSSEATVGHISAEPSDVSIVPSSHADRAALPRRNTASPQPAASPYPGPPAMYSTMHPIQHPTGHIYQSYPSSTRSGDGFAYAGHSGPAFARHGSESHNYARPPSRNNSQSSSSHDSAPYRGGGAGGGGGGGGYAPAYHAYSHYAPTPSYYPTGNPPAMPLQTYGDLAANGGYGLGPSSNFAPAYSFQHQAGHYLPQQASSHQGLAQNRTNWHASNNSAPSNASQTFASNSSTGRRHFNSASRSNAPNPHQSNHNQHQNVYNTNNFNPHLASRRAGPAGSSSSSSPRRGTPLLARKPGTGSSGPIQAEPSVQSDTKIRNSLSNTSVMEDGLLPADSGISIADDVDVTESVPDSGLDALAPSSRIPGRGLRPHYHPQQGPRSEFVMWCGNVPQDATVEELWSLFSQLPSRQDDVADSTVNSNQDSSAPQMIPDEFDNVNEDIEGHGVLSIFIISRSNCAFVNYSSPAHLERAVKHFHSKQVRPHDSRCPKLVCRVRKKDDEAQAGVAGQRGRGIHVAWLKQQKAEALAGAQSLSLQQPLSSAAGPGSVTGDPDIRASSETLSPAPVASASPASPSQHREASGAVTSAASGGSYSSSGSTSYTSTNSSLFRHPAFRHRFFILKSLRRDDLDRSIETGYWATQPHNEGVLDQAYRNSESVFLIFGVNQTGQFFGYAKMAGPIHTSTETKDDKDEQRRISLSSVLSSASGAAPQETIAESVDEADGDGSHANRRDHVIAGGALKGHPTLPKSDIDAARALFAVTAIDTGDEGLGSGALPMNSPLPLSPSLEDAGLPMGAKTSQEGSSTPRGFGSLAQANTWPHTTSKASVSDGTAASTAADSVTSTSSEHAPSISRGLGDIDEHGVRRRDMETESQGLSSQSDQPSLAPSDSASWSSADPRMAEQIALRAVIHNLRLDEMESRGKAEQLESQLRSASTHTDATDATVTSADGDAGNSGDTRTPPRQSSSDSWGKPFRVEWIRTDPLPFHRVKKLRNPWRDNRQIKVSRDGTELEPGVGRQLLEEWDREDESQSKSQASGKPGPSLGSDEDE
ncbi:hypothetical protein BCV70DRAFT_84454 [Testicularia cyperi]|uniref:YTH domain-containing protein n=1 Tax=Testicularia cyperi TaxID=1882483 RepID=A0A317XSP5_9BASI|nr:hypothetical protein BCV70DRAFT_84454 [Testicularia cyperi]